MNRIQYALNRSSGSELRQIVEPLANYICATERPKTALVSALRVLFAEVEATNQAATRHFRNILEN
jgi:hypothetical protein